MLGMLTPAAILARSVLCCSSSRSEIMLSRLGSKRTASYQLDFVYLDRTAHWRLITSGSSVTRIFGAIRARWSEKGYRVRIAVPLSSSPKADWCFSKSQAVVSEETYLHVLTCVDGDKTRESGDGELFIIVPSLPRSCFSLAYAHTKDRWAVRGSWLGGVMVSVSVRFLTVSFACCLKG